MPSKNPTLVAKQCNFTLYNPEEKTESKKHIGICECGTKCSVSYESLRKRKFCRNTECKYFQPQKRLDKNDMKIIMEDKKCEIISISDDVKSVCVSTSTRVVDAFFFLICQGNLEIC